MEAGGEHEWRLKVSGCTGQVDQCPAHTISESKWRFVPKPEDIEKLVEACNARGLREIDLVENITFFKVNDLHLSNVHFQKRLVAIIEKTERRMENGQLAGFFMKETDDPFTADTTVNWEQEMREMIADLEEKVLSPQAHFCRLSRARWVGCRLRTEMGGERHLLRRVM